MSIVFGQENSQEFGYNKGCAVEYACIYVSTGRSKTSRNVKKTKTSQRKCKQTTDLQTNLSKHETSQKQQNKLDNKVNQIKLNKVYIHVSLWTKKQEPAMSLG